MKLIILTPVYNDWESFIKLLEEINSTTWCIKNDVSVVAVNDGSIDELNISEQQKKSLDNIKRIDIVHLSRNMGHQKAIAVGISYVVGNMEFDNVVIMDADGEDDPAAIQEMILANEKHQGKIIFAHRAKRSEKISFRIFYQIYKFCYRVLTGASISFGNFCLIPRQTAEKIVYLTEIWDHFSAGIIRSKLPYDTIPVNRRMRYTGESKMNFVSLVIHGLSAISVNIDVVATRLLIGSAGMIAATVIGLLVVVAIRFFTTIAIPGWATTAFMGLLIILFLALSFSGSIVFLILHYRTQKFLVQVKADDYIMAVDSVYENSKTTSKQGE